jgi:mRNA interferase RelE/StbE
MAYSVQFSQEARANLEKLDPPTARRVIEKIKVAAADPFHYFKRLTNSELYKLRAGDWRILALINPTNDTLFIVTLGHRKNIYE